MARRFRVFDTYVTEDYSDIDPEEIWDVDGPAYEWCKKYAKILEDVTRRTAPPGQSHARWKARGASTGELRAGITAVGFRTGEESYRMVLNSAAWYSEFVHGGTAYARGSYIYSDAGFANRAFIDSIYKAKHAGKGSGAPILPIPGKMFMNLPPGAGHFNRFHLRVRGQLANAFLYRGWNRTNDLYAEGQLGGFTEWPIGYVEPPGVHSIRAIKR